ncbi:MAG: exopolysaccharide production protein, partial [Glaciihabitans sp.]|nr:exopolysaccharide production protein [Glaciihabitans sp.]
SVILLGLRRLKPETRRVWQTMLGVASIITIFLVYVFRARVIELLNAGSEFSYRVDLWHTLLALIQQHLLEGFGWVGSWRPEIQPFIAINEASPQAHQSALNAFLDVWMQLGLVGLLSFAALVALAFSRSWILASQQRSRSYVWPALVLVALLTTSLAESSMIIEAGWMTLIICAVKASQRLSWRRQLPEIQEPLDAPSP